MRQINLFWQVLETHPARQAVALEWRHLLRDEWNAACAFLRPLQREAQSYPCTRSPACGCYHEVVKHDDNDYSAVCTCADNDCPTISVLRDDLIVYGLNRRVLAEKICVALTLSQGYLELDGDPDLYHVGRYNPSGATFFPVYLALAWDSTELLAYTESLVARYHPPFILLTPTSTHVSPAVSKFLKESESIHLGLDTTCALDEDDRLICVTDPWELLLPFGKMHVPAFGIEEGGSRIYVPPGTSWGAVEFVIHNADRMTVYIRNKPYALMFDGFGLTKSVQGTRALSVLGMLLCDFALTQGFVRCPSREKRASKKQQVKRLREKLRRILDIPGDPIVPHNDFSGWRTIFKIRQELRE